MKFNKWTFALAALAAVSLCLAPAVRAQGTTSTNSITTITGTTTNSAAAPAEFLPASLEQLWAAIDNSDVLQATNWALAPYVTYAPSAADKVGAGALAIYNVPQLTSSLGSVGTALGVDWLGSWSLISANATIQVPTHPLAHITWLTPMLPASVTNITCVPFAIAGIGTPMSGSSTAGAATLWDVGYQVKFGHWAGGNFGVGITWGEWMNAGPESGHRYHIFVSYQKGF
jgi:hypothetical protein